MADGGKKNSSANFQFKCSGQIDVKFRTDEDSFDADLQQMVARMQAFCKNMQPPGKAGDCKDHQLDSQPSENTLTPSEKTPPSKGTLSSENVVAMETENRAKVDENIAKFQRESCELEKNRQKIGQSVENQATVQPRKASTPNVSWRPQMMSSLVTEESPCTNAVRSGPTDSEQLQNLKVKGHPDQKCPHCHPNDTNVCIFASPPLSDSDNAENSGSYAVSESQRREMENFDENEPTTTARATCRITASDRRHMDDHDEDHDKHDGARRGVNGNAIDKEPAISNDTKSAQNEKTKIDGASKERSNGVKDGKCRNAQLVDISVHDENQAKNESGNMESSNFRYVEVDDEISFKIDVSNDIETLAKTLSSEETKEISKEPPLCSVESSGGDNCFGTCSTSAKGETGAPFKNSSKVKQNDQVPLCPSEPILSVLTSEANHQVLIGPVVETESHMPQKYRCEIVRPKPVKRILNSPLKTAFFSGKMSLLPQGDIAPMNRDYLDTIVEESAEERSIFERVVEDKVGCRSHEKLGKVPDVGVKPKVTIADAASDSPENSETSTSSVPSKLCLTEMRRLNQTAFGLHRAKAAFPFT